MVGQVDADAVHDAVREVEVEELRYERRREDADGAENDAQDDAHAVTDFALQDGGQRAGQTVGTDGHRSDPSCG